VSLSFQSSAWAERASQQHAQLLLQLGRFPEAAAAFSQHVARYRRGKDAFAARHGYGLALLGVGRAKMAKDVLSALRHDKASSPSYQSQLLELEGVALLRAGDRPGAIRIWLGLLRDEPLTFPALAAHARLRAVGHTPLPPLMTPAPVGERPPIGVALPAGPALLHEVGLDDAAERRLVALEDEIAARYPGRESEALCAIYGLLPDARRRMQIGNRATSWALLMRPPTVHERWAWSCVYPEPYPMEVRKAEARHELPLGLGHAIMRQESAFRVDAESEAGALGLMQLMPETASKLGQELGRELLPGDLLRPDVNIDLGTSYLGKLLKSFRGSLPLAVAGYNAGPQAVRSWLGAPAEREVDLWVARIPYSETRDYVVRVLGNLARYQYLVGGANAVEPLVLELPAEVDVSDDAY
jgi:soluble lytic murein transglycosylase